MKLRRLGTAMILIFLASSLVGAATLTVTSPNPVIAADGQCSLIEAIINANDDTQTHVDCSAGSGADTIVLNGITYTLTEPYDGFNGLPDITSPITIEGNDATIARDTRSDKAFRIFEVSGVLQGDEVDGDLTLYNTTVTGGYVQADGGGIYSRGGPLTLIDVTVTGNTTILGGVVSDGDGGGVLTWGLAMIINSTISDNNSPRLGGGVAGDEFIIIDSTISDNTGDGIWGRETTLINSTISGNEGTGIWGDDSVISTNSTISGNTFVGIEMSEAAVFVLINSTVVGNMGGLYITAPEYGDVEVLNLFNNIIANNGFDCSIEGIPVSSGNLIQDGSCGSEFPPGTDPMLGLLKDNGGPTETHAVLAGSPAIDGGGEVCLDADGQPLTTDQRGQSRPVDGNGDGFNACDIGAFEIQKVVIDLPPIVIPPIPNTDFTGSSSGSGCFIATAAFGSPMAKEVELLRGLRDEHLMTNAVGRWIVAVYYEYSPPVADVIAQHELLRKATRVVLMPLVFIVKYPGVSLSTVLMMLMVMLVLARRRMVVRR